jgi:hypothetical protein
LLALLNTFKYELHLVRYLLAILVFYAPVSFAWTMSGHRVVAEITWAELNFSTKTTIIELLEQHPDYTEGFLKRMPEDLPEHAKAKWIFREAAAWPDVVKEYRQTNTFMYEQFHRGSWHYINIPTYTGMRGKREYESLIEENLSLTPPADFGKGLNVIQAIKLHMEQYESESSTASEKALSLSWLLHLIGDLHQPLHSTGLYGLPSLEAGGDQGGNLICLSGQGSTKSLHVFWDLQIIDVDSIDEIEQIARSLLQTRGESLQIQSEASEIEAWLGESLELANSRAYSPEVLGSSFGLINGENCKTNQAERISLSIGYKEMSKDISADRAVLAAKRLASFLNQTF